MGIILKNSILDPAVSKYFISAQLSIQYLSFCIQYLEKTVYNLKNINQSNEEEIVKLKKCVRKKESETLQLLKRLHSKVINQSVHPCNKCAKSFDGIDNLNAHLVRKHQISYSMESLGPHPVSDANLINAIKLELDIKKLKERLNDAEKLIINSETTNAGSRINVDKCYSCQQRKSIKHADFSTQTDVHDNAAKINAINDEKYKIIFEEMKNKESEKYDRIILELKSQLNNLMTDFSNEFSRKNRSETKEIFESASLNNNLIELKKHFTSFEELFNENREQLNKNIKSLEENMKVFEKSLYNKSTVKIVEKPVALPRNKINQSLIPIPVVRDIPKPLERCIKNESLMQLNSDIRTTNDNQYESYDRDLTVAELLTKPISKPKLISVKNPRSDYLPKKSNNGLDLIKIEQKQSIENLQSIERNDVTKLLELRMAEHGINLNENKLTTEQLETVLDNLSSKRKFNSIYAELYNNLKTKIDNLSQRCLGTRKNDVRLDFNEFMSDLRVFHTENVKIGNISRNMNMYDDDDDDKDINEINITQEMAPVFKKRVVFDLKQQSEFFDSQSILSSTTTSSNITK